MRALLLASLAFLLAGAALFSFAPPAKPIGSSASRTPSSGPPRDPGFGSDPVWDDGMAEVARYRAIRLIYGKPREHEAILITVKEDMNAANLVKADPPYQGKTLLPTLKLNLVAEVPTENYDYRYLTCVFVSRQDPFELRKATVGSQEWCGNVFQEILPGKAGAELHYHSYFDGEGDGTRALDLRSGDLLEEQCFIALRSLSFREGLSFRTNVLSPVTGNHSPAPELRAFDFRVVGKENVKTEAGDRSAWRVEGKQTGGGGTTLTYRFAADPGHVLLTFDSGDGRTLDLRDVTRRRYW